MAMTNAERMKKYREKLKKYAETYFWKYKNYPRDTKDAFS